MKGVQELLRADETISETTHFSDNGLVDYSIHTIKREGLRDGDEVLLEIRPILTEEVVLVGGNPLELEVLHGRGEIHEIDLATGEKTTTYLDVNNQKLHTISPSNTLYWYGNPYAFSTFVVRDHCDDFDPANEPGLDKVVDGLIRVMQLA